MGWHRRIVVRIDGCIWGDGFAALYGGSDQSVFIAVLAIAEGDSVVQSIDQFLQCSFFEPNRFAGLGDGVEGLVEGFDFGLRVF